MESLTFFPQFFRYEDDKKHGYGTFIWADGRKYIGEWKKGKQHGKGTFIKTNGQSRDGEWIDGRRVKWLDEAVEGTN